MSRHGLPPAEDGELLALYREGAASEPGAQLDQRILAAARADLHAAGASAGKRRRPWWTAWLKPVSVLAVALFGVSLTWQVMDEQQRDELQRDRGQETRAAHDQPRSANTDEPGLAAQAPAATPPAAKAQVPAVKERAPAAAYEAARAPAKLTQPQAFPAPEEVRKRPADAAASGSVAATDAAPAPLAVSPTSPAEKKNLRVEGGDARNKDKRSDALGETAAAGSTLPDERREAASRAGPHASKADALGKAEADAATPQAWLARIRELRAAGREAEAEQSLARFRARYPDFVVPDDLKAPR